MGRGAFGFINADIELAIEPDHLISLLWCRENPYAEASEHGSSARRSLEIRGALDGEVRKIGLHLHQEVVRSSSSVNAQMAQSTSQISAHRPNQVVDLMRDTLERRARDVGLRRAPSNPFDQASRGA